MKKLVLSVLAVVSIGLVGCGQTQITSQNVEISGSGTVAVVSKSIVSESGTKVVLEQSLITLKEGQIFRLSGKVLHTDGTNGLLLWETSDDTIASVDQTTGLLVGINKGKVTLTASSSDGAKNEVTVFVQ